MGASRRGNPATSEFTESAASSESAARAPRNDL
jgi:hypothetical protein